MSHTPTPGCVLGESRAVSSISARFFLCASLCLGGFVSNRVSISLTQRDFYSETIGRRS